jgi:hypothetical protein
MSNVFGSERPRKAHLVKPAGGVGGEVYDLRADIDRAFGTLEANQNPETSGIVHVSKAGNDSTGDGSISQPFATVQAAVDLIESFAVVPTSGSEALVLLGPGIYDENVLIQKDGLYMEIRGLTESQTPLIYPTAGVPITITNASEASLATYRGSGTYSDLAAKAVPEAGPTSISLVNLKVQPAATNLNGLEALGVEGDATASTTDFLFSLALVNTTLFGSGTGDSMYARNVGTVSAFRAVFIQHGQIYNAANLDLQRCKTFTGFTSYYESTDSEGQPDSGFLAAEIDDCDLGGDLTLGGSESFTVNRSMCSSDLILNDSVAATVKATHIVRDLIPNDTAAFVGSDVFIERNLDINGASGDISCKRIYVDGSMTVTVGKTGTFDAPHIAGAVTFDNGAGAWTFNGGEYMGALTDVGVRLTFNLGTIGT